MTCAAYDQLITCTVFQPVTRCHGCIHAVGTGTLSITSSLGERTDRMSERQMPWVVQIGGPTTGSSYPEWITLQSKRRPQGSKATKHLNVVNKLKTSLAAEDLAAELESPFSELHPGNSVEDDWTAFRDTVYATSFKILSPSTQKQHDWSDTNDGDIKDLLAEKHCLHQAHQNDPSSVPKKAAFAKLQKMQNAWLSNDMKQFYDALKTLYGPLFFAGSSPLLGSGGSTIITVNTKILERWTEHFESVLNRPSTMMR